ncbi:hypothetical protein BDF14DRAFT_1802120 [Spinellus fusiger]|nr:hypothetical protein BDF14DRAFT_1802120 [Spinellus fusiger]
MIARMGEMMLSDESDDDECEDYTLSFSRQHRLMTATSSTSSCSANSLTTMKQHIAIQDVSRSDSIASRSSDLSYESTSSCTNHSWENSFLSRNTSLSTELSSPDTISSPLHHFAATATSIPLSHLHERSCFPHDTRARSYESSHCFVSDPSAACLTLQPSSFNYSSDAVPTHVLQPLEIPRDTLVFTKIYEPREPSDAESTDSDDTDLLVILKKKKKKRLLQ